MSAWPHFQNEAERFYSNHLSRPRRLLKEFTAKGTGSGRRSGPRDLLWQSVVASSVASLEAGLEDLVFAAHASRLGYEGQEVQVGKNAPQKKPRSWLVESRLMAPGAQKLERVIFSDFGTMLGTLPTSAQFTVMRKGWSKGGQGRGSATPGPQNWKELRRYLDTLAYIRNATAHADVGKLGACPQHCEAELWLQKEDGTWSVQQPHGLNAVRTVLSIYNTTADALAGQLAVPSPNLTSPDMIDYPKKQ